MDLAEAYERAAQVACPVDIWTAELQKAADRIRALKETPDVD